MHVVRVNYLEDGKCSCGWKHCPAPGKHPADDAWNKPPAPDEDRIASWFESGTPWNLGIVVPDYLIDIDPRNGGSVESVCRAAGLSEDELLMNAHARSGGGGWHIMFSAPDDDRPLRKMVDSLPGIDLLRGPNHQFLVEPSTHPSGGQYRWLMKPQRVWDEWVNVTPLPPALVDLYAEPPVSERGPQNWDELLGGGVKAGERDERIFRYACRLFSQGLSYAEVEALTQVAASRCRPPLPAGQASAKVASAAKYREPEKGADSTPDLRPEHRMLLELAERGPSIHDEKVPT